MINRKAHKSALAPLEHLSNDKCHYYDRDAEGVLLCNSVSIEERRR